jgi:Protein of unknown function (DUF3105)
MRRALILASFLAGCGTPAEVIEVEADEDGKTDNAKRLSIEPGQSYVIKYKSSGDARRVTVDCKPSSNPDSLGVTFNVIAPELGAPDWLYRAGYFSASAELEAGAYRLELDARSDSPKGTCTVSVQRAGGECTSASSWHSPNTNHTHIAVGKSASDWEPFPVSGNHWGAWAEWDRDYSKPVKRGYVLHNLEHGGIVLSYNCSSPTASAACRAAHAALVQLKESFGEARVIVTPDPTQPARYGIRAWRWAYTSDCVDETKMLTFMDRHFRQGREDEDANPPIPFDPTTTKVPCQDLMSAPDSCP